MPQQKLPRLLIIGALFIAGAALIWIAQQMPSSSVPTSQETPQGQQAAPQAPPVVSAPPAASVPSPSPSPSPEASPPATSSVTSPYELTVPSKETLLEEVKENPHITPPSLIDFARDLSRKSDEAAKSPEAASRFFTELERCADGRDTTTPVQVQTLCLGSASELAKTYPRQLKSRYEDLKKTTSSEALRLRKAFESLGHQ